MQPKALAKSPQVYCQLENQEAFSVCCNILLVACSGKKKKSWKLISPSDYVIIYTYNMSIVAQKNPLTQKGIKKKKKLLSITLQGRQKVINNVSM